MYYDYFNHHAYRGATKGKTVTVPAELHQLPLLVRGGSILATRERPRRASSLMKKDPFTLRVALSKAGDARGELYLDDGVTYDHLKGDYVWRSFEATKAGKKGVRLTSKDLGAAKPDQAVDGVALTTYNPKNNFVTSIDSVRVEKIVVVGLSAKPSSVKVDGGSALVWEWIAGVAASDKKEGAASILSIIVKDPKVSITKDWAIVIQ